MSIIKKEETELEMLERLGISHDDWNAPAPPDPFPQDPCPVISPSRVRLVYGAGCLSATSGPQVEPTPQEDYLAPSIRTSYSWHRKDTPPFWFDGNDDGSPSDDILYMEHSYLIDLCRLDDEMRAISAKGTEERRKNNYGRVLLHLVFCMVQALLPLIGVRVRTELKTRGIPYREPDARALLTSYDCPELTSADKLCGNRCSWDREDIGVGRMSYYLETELLGGVLRCFPNATRVLALADNTYDGHYVHRGRQYMFRAYDYQEILQPWITSITEGLAGDDNDFALEPPDLDWEDIDLDWYRADTSRRICDGRQPEDRRCGMIASKKRRARREVLKAGEEQKAKEAEGAEKAEGAERAKAAAVINLKALAKL